MVGPFAITSPNSQGSAITIENTTKDFTITGISANYTNTDPGEAVIHLSGVTGPATVNNVSANDDGIGGYVLDGASNTTIENSSAEAGGPICISLNGGKEPSGYFNTGLMANLMLIDGAHNNTIENGTFEGYLPTNGYDIAGTPNTFYFDVCTGADSATFMPSGAAMGSGNTFSNLCYKASNDVPGLPPSTCKS